MGQLKFSFFFNPSADEPGGKPESAMARGQKLFLPGTLLPVKNTFITEAETIHAGTTDIAQQAGEHTEKQFSGLLGSLWRILMDC